MNVGQAHIAQNGMQTFQLPFTEILDGFLNPLPRTGQILEFTIGNLSKSALDRVAGDEIHDFHKFIPWRRQFLHWIDGRQKATFAHVPQLLLQTLLLSEPATSQSQLFWVPVSGLLLHFSIAGRVIDSHQEPFQLVQRQLRMSHGLELHGGISAQHAQQNVGTAGMLPQVFFDIVDLPENDQPSVFAHLLCCHCDHIRLGCWRRCPVWTRIPHGAIADPHLNITPEAGLEPFEA
mmetsp:Transcript_22918/g.37293  ORF Transcript_22918/g.37293 Transcript_22918/m.37293 type:complete len:234 (-) Transcript_22918:2-703(-)